MEFPNVPGLGFYPNDDLILKYLKERVSEQSRPSFFPDVDLCQFKPWDLPPHIESYLPMGHPNQYKWYFFCPRKESRNGTTSRTVPKVGHWKVTGKKQDVVSADTGEVIGKKSILIFHGSGSGSSSSGNGSWVIHEYHLSPSYLGNNIPEMSFVACVLKKK